ncbi:EAL domain-containing protein [Polaromonas jejuensis]|uniref:EAL domain-containing protein n=1 Tax=Polaromonas jejuensis TaxID=457502 RepID=A0ABW0QCX7_9BURK|nr:EAL domain-containing protein [Polaromonas jejuensis]
MPALMSPLPSVPDCKNSSPAGEDSSRPLFLDADRIARLAARTCGVPIALVALSENGQLILAAGTGFAEHERLGLMTLCAAAQQTPQQLPAACAPGIVFYRGLPLRRKNGEWLGVLAVAARLRHSLSRAQQEDLETLATLLAGQLDLQRQQREEGHAIASERDQMRTAMQQSREDAQNLAARLGTALESITEGFFTLDPHWRFTYLNREAGLLLHQPGGALLGASFWQAFPGALNAAFSEQLRAAAASRHAVEFDALHAPPDRWLEVRAYPFADGLAIYFRDVSERRKAREQLMLLETSISRLNDIVLIAQIRPSGKPGLRIIFVNKAFEQHTGYSHQEALGRSPRHLLCGALTQRSELERIQEALQQGKPVQAELITYKKNGRHFWMEVDMVPVANEAGPFFTHWVAVGRNITRRKVAESEIKHLAFYDPLTHLPNRQLLMERLQQALSDPHQQEGALMFIDMDNFKTLNDTQGHHKGDLLLQQVATRLMGCVRQTDTVARLGGDEFVVMLKDLGHDPGQAADRAEAVGQQILAALSESYHLAGDQHYSSCSIGVTAFNQKPVHNIADLLKQADLAMYQAKMAGRNTLCFYDPAMQAAVSASAALQSDLRQGLREGQFLLHYQPQVGRDGRMTGVEALLRWQHARRGLVRPAEFIAAAEEGGLILPLGQWALETACQQLAAWAHQPSTAGLSMAINVSVRQFRQPEFVDRVMATLNAAKVSPHKLKLELTESLFADDMDISIRKLARLKDLGVTLSLDDFGMGYSSLSCLKRLPLDQLKIDKSFVHDILRDPNDAAIARTIIALAQSLGLGVLAEGVETEAQRAFLAHHGCECYQGHLFCKPLPIEALQNFMAALPP